MKLKITDRRTIKEIQDEFNALFPWLMLEFFTKPHGEGRPSPKKQMISGSNTIEELRTVHTNGSISIDPSMTVSSLEQEFSNVYGLSVQVFRHSGNSWLETTTTDSWTLEKQNEHGKELSELHRH